MCYVPQLSSYCDASSYCVRQAGSEMSQNIHAELYSLHFEAHEALVTEYNFNEKYIWNVDEAYRRLSAVLWVRTA